MNVTTSFSCNAGDNLLEVTNIINAISSYFPSKYINKLNDQEPILLSFIIMLKDPRPLATIQVRKNYDVEVYGQNFLQGGKVMSVDTRRIVQIITDTQLEGTIILTLDNDRYDQVW